MDIFLENFINDKFKKPGKALDLGAGKFFDVACLKQLGWEAYGVDKLSGTNLDEPFCRIKSRLIWFIQIICYIS